MQGYCLNVLSVVFHAIAHVHLRGIWFSTLGLGLGRPGLDMVHTRHSFRDTSIQRSDPGSLLFRWAFKHHFCGVKQLLLLFTYCGFGPVVHSESYDTASTQCSESVRVSTQLATTCGWLESNGTSTQRSESGFPSTLRVRRIGSWARSANRACARVFEASKDDFHWGIGSTKLWPFHTC